GEGDEDVDGAIGVGPERADGEAHQVVQRAPEERETPERIEGGRDSIYCGVAEVDGVVVGVLAELAAEVERGGEGKEDGEHPGGEKASAIGRRGRHGVGEGTRARKGAA